MSHWSRPQRFAAEIALASIPALITAALHLCIATVQREVFDSGLQTWNSRDVSWMLLLGYHLVFWLCALPLAIVAAARRAGLPARARVWYWTTLAAFAVLLLFPRVHSATWLLVALGVGYQVARWAERRPEAWTRLLRRTSVALAAGFAVVVTATLARREWTERSLMAALPGADAGAPNVLLIIWDTVRAKNLSLHGYSRPTTPFLDSLARSAVVFDYAYSTAPWTLPAHASMLTGHYASQQSGGFVTPLDDTHRTLPEALHSEGYASAAFVGNLIMGGYSTGLHRGFARYEGYTRTPREAWTTTTLTQARSPRLVYHYLVRRRLKRQALRALLSFDWRPIETHQIHARKPAQSVTDAFLSWQARVRRPYFAMLNYMDAHGGQDSPARRKFNSGRRLEDVYDGAIWWLDGQLRVLLSELEKRGELDRTIVIVTSDHGEQFGEHGVLAHANSLYSVVLHVPLVIYAPGRLEGGVRITRAVSLRDMARTIQDLTGIGKAEFPGASLARVASDSSAPSSPVIAEVQKAINMLPRDPNYWGAMTATLDDTLHIIRNGKGQIEAYAYRSDVDERENLALDPARARDAARLLERRLQQVRIVDERQP